MTEVFLPSCLVEAFRGVEPSDDSATVIAALGLGELGVATGGFAAAMTAALWHESYLYENLGEAPGLTPGTLSALEALGKTWLTRELALEVYKTRHDEKPGTLSRTVHGARQVLTTALTERAGWPVDCGRFSRGLQGDRPQSVHIRILHQVLGMACLAGGSPAISKYVAPFLHQALKRAESEADWVTVLQQAVAAQRLPVDWSYSASGPDHQKVFTATCRVGSRLQAEAVGESKKAARWGSARQMLLENFPHALADEGGSASRPCPPSFVPRTNNPAFGRTVASIASQFGLEASATPLLAQAFLHMSWVYENQNEARQANQRDHGVLGFVGAMILDYEAALAEAADQVRNPSDQFSHRTHELSTDVRTLRILGLEPAIAMGRGQASKGVTLEIASSTFQALIAALHVSVGSPRSLFEKWPTVEPWTEARSVIAPGTAQSSDERTMLQEFAAPCGLEITYEFEREGPDHHALYTAVLVLDSPILRRRLRVRGAGASGKRMALRSASRVVMDWVESIEDADRLSEVASSDNSSITGSTFLLGHLCETARGLISIPTPWRRRGLLGASMRGSDLSRWAAAADTVLLRQAKVRLDPNSLVDYFRALDGPQQGLPLAQLITDTLAWVATIDARSPVDAREQRRLVDLAAAYRLLGGSQDPVSFDDLVEGQVLLGRGRLDHDGGREIVGMAPASTAAAFESIVGLMLAGGRRVSVANSASHGVTMRWPDPTSPAGVDELRPTIDVWREVGVPITLDETSCTVLLGIVPDLADAGGPITAALRRAQAPQSSPLAAAVANLLHDLKNQVSAIDLLARTPDAGSRTAQLEKELAASRHLDQAAALAERVRAASSLLKASVAEPTPLSTFLRRYAAAMLVRLPAAVSLDVGAGDEGLSVAMSEPAMTAVLDNLIKNSIEAMPSGGRIKLDWTHDEEVAVVEIADDGPGLPAAVRRALEAGERVDSTKLGGNGLGLLGVRALLRRVGGTFELGRSTAGTTWHLTIPVAEERAP